MATATPAEKPPMPIESGCPDGFRNMHPMMRKNYGNWAYHDDPQPGVLRHVAHGGDEIYTVKAATQRILDVFTLRKLCDIGDEFADGHVHFTMRSNLEFFVTEKERVQPLINALEDAGFVVGGTKNSVTSLSHTQGWLHCDIPGTDASGVVKAMMDEATRNIVHNGKQCRTSYCNGATPLSWFVHVLRRISHPNWRRTQYTNFLTYTS